MGRSWRAEAACLSMDPDVFFPMSEVDQEFDAARQVCRSCPVQFECLEYAMATRQDDGVWGGLSPSERRRLKRRRAAQPTRLVG